MGLSFTSDTIFASSSLHWLYRSLAVPCPSHAFYSRLSRISLTNFASFQKPFLRPFCVLYSWVLSAQVFTPDDDALAPVPHWEVWEYEPMKDIICAMYEARDEGVIVKRSDHKYVPGARQNAGWFKWKPEYNDDLIETVDLVIVGGYVTAHCHTDAQLTLCESTRVVYNFPGHDVDGISGC
jgi:hypothetical protein